MQSPSPGALSKGGVRPLNQSEAQSAAAASAIPVQWPPVRVVTLGGPSDFGWVETQGAAVVRGQAGTRGCFCVRARDSAGRAFDRAGQQRAFFTGRLQSQQDPLGPFFLQVSVTFLPGRLKHLACYTAPTAGLFQLQILLVYTDAYAIIQGNASANASTGFANYTPVLTANVTVAALALSKARGSTRTFLPICSAALIQGSRNAGFWRGLQWYPLACRLPRLSPTQALSCFRGKRVLFAGDSQARIAFGILLLYLRAPHRLTFLNNLSKYPYFVGDVIGRGRISTNTSDNGKGPPINATSGAARRSLFPCLNSTGTFYGGAYQGFALCSGNVMLVTGGKPTTFTVDLTYSSSFSIGAPLFSRWKTAGGNLTSGASVLSSGNASFDMVFQANQIHDMVNFQTVKSYTSDLTTGALKQFRKYTRPTGSVTMFGPLSLVEARKLANIGTSSTPRHMAFEAATAQALSGQDLVSYFPMQPITGLRDDLAYDCVHYKWPVSLAMLDLWLGTSCANTTAFAT